MGIEYNDGLSIIEQNNLDKCIHYIDFKPEIVFEDAIDIKNIALNQKILRNNANFQNFFKNYTRSNDNFFSNVSILECKNQIRVSLSFVVFVEEIGKIQFRINDYLFF